MTRAVMARERVTPRGRPYQATAASGPAAARRVLVVAPQPFYEDRGTPIAVRRVLEALGELGHEVDLLTFPVGRDVPLPGVRVLRSANPLRIRQVPVGFSAAKLALDAALIPALARQLARERYLYVHALEEAAFPAVWLARRRGTPVVYDMQSSLPEQLAKHPLLGRRLVQRMLRRAERWLLRNASLVVSSAGLAERVRAIAPATRVREWIYPALGGTATAAEVRELRRELGIPETSPVVLYGGTFEPYQGLSLLLDAAVLVRAARPDAVFVFVGGDGAMTAAVERQGAALGLGDAARVLGRQPRERMPAFLTMADVLVSPRTRVGNVPLKVFDYLASGRPIVATDIPAHRALLSEERAMLVPARAAAVARAVAALLDDPERAARLGAAGRAYAESALGWPAFLASVDALSVEATTTRPVPEAVHDA